MAAGLRVKELPILAQEIVAAMNSPTIDAGRISDLVNAFVLKVEKVFNSFQWVTVINEFEFDDSFDKEQ